MEELYGDTVTQLSPMEENQFSAWAGKMRLEGKIHPQDNFEDYDMRGYWKNEVLNNTELANGSSDLHFTDKYKRPNHPTFSTESIYAQGEFGEKYGKMAGHWEDDNFIPPVSDEELYNKYKNDEQNEYSILAQKESLEKKFGITIDDYYDNDLDRTITTSSGNLSGKTIEDIADAKDMPTTFVEDLCDISYGFFSGVYEGLRAVQELGAAAGAKIAELQTGKKIDFDPDKDTRGIGFNQGEAPDTVTKLGGLAKGVGQVGVGLMGSSAVGATKLAALAKTAYGSKAVSLLANAFVGFTVDTMSFSANEANFADVLKALGLPTIESLAKNPDDTFWQKKLKNGLDGVAAGVVIDGITKAAKMFYNAGKRAIANRKVYEGILEYPPTATIKRTVTDAEFEIVQDGVLNPSSTKEIETPMTRVITEEGEKLIPTKEFNRIEFKPSRERQIAEDFKNMIGASEERANQFASAIENKDYDFLVDYISNTSNKKSRAIFEKYTGVKLPNKIKESEKAVVEWAGKDYKEYLKEQDIIQETAKKEAEKQAKIQALEESTENLKKRMVNYEGKVINYKEYIDTLKDEGYKLVGKSGPYYKLQNGKGYYITIKDKDVKKYIDSLFENSKKSGGK